MPLASILRASYALVLATRDDPQRGDVKIGSRSSLATGRSVWNAIVWPDSEVKSVAPPKYLRRERSQSPGASAWCSALDGDDDRRPRSLGGLRAV
jgi:hypothetical protein